MLLGDVRQVQEVGERPRDWQRGANRHSREFVRQPFEISLRSAAGALCQCPHPFDGAEELVPFDRSQGVPEQIAEQPDVLTKRFVRIVHRPECGMRNAGCAIRLPQFLLEERDGAVPRELRRLFVVARRRVVVEAVPGAWIFVCFITHTGCFQRRLVGRK